MDDFERAVLVCLDPTTDKTLQQQALQYCTQIADSADAITFVLGRLNPSLRAEVAFWCLQVLHKKVRTAIDCSDPPGSETSSLPGDVRDAVLKYVMGLVGPGNESVGARTPVYVRNKLAQVVAALVAASYPAHWPGGMREFVLPLASDANSRTPPSLDFFFRVMRALDEEVTSIRAAQASEVCRLVSVRVKDAIRVDCTNQLVSLLATLVAVPAYADHAYDLVARNVEWCDISLFSNDAFLPAMYNAITSVGPSPARAASAYALRAIIMKRMPPEAKLELLNHLQVKRLLVSIPPVVPEDDDVANGAQQPEKLPTLELPIQSGQRETAALVNVTALTALDVLKSAVSGKKNAGSVAASETQAMVQSAGSVAETALPLALRFIGSDVDEAALDEALQCVTSYINTYGRLNAMVGALTADQASGVAQTAGMPSTTWTLGQEGIVATLKVIEERACFPTDFDPTDEDHPFQMVRRVLIQSALRGITRALPETVLAFARALAGAAAASGNIAKAELTLTVLRLLAETANPELPDLANTLKQGLVSPPAVVGTPDEVGSAAFRQMEAAAIAFFSLAVSCYKLILTSKDQGLLLSVLSPFFDERGIRHPLSDRIRASSSHLLLKLARPLRTSITYEHLKSAMDSILPLLFPIEVDTDKQSYVDQMNLYEVAGYLIGTDSSRPDSIRYLSSLLQAIVSSLDASRTPASLVGAVSAAGQLSKGFGGDSKPLLLAGIQDSSPLVQASTRGVNIPNGGSTAVPPDAMAADGGTSTDVKVQKPRPLSTESLDLWRTCLEAVLKSVGVSNSADATADRLSVSLSDADVKERLLFFLHRMVDTIGMAVVPYLSLVLQPLLEASQSPFDVRSVVVLLSQAVGKFGSGLDHVVALALPAVAKAVAAYPTNVDSATMMAMSEDDREVVELHKAYLYFVYSAIGSSSPQAFLSDQNAQILPGIVASLVEVTAGLKLDVRVAASMMKLSMGALAKMVLQWISPNGADVLERVQFGVVNGAAIGFRQYIALELPRACVQASLASTLFRNGDYSSSAATSVLSECVALQKACALRLGPDWATAMRSAGLANKGSQSVERFLAMLYDPASAPQALSKLWLAVITEARA